MYNILFLLILMVIFSCITQPALPEWLIGNWKLIDATLPTYETWLANNDSMYEGIAWRINASDTVFLEKLEIVSRADGLYYIADVAQNPEPVKFKATEYSHKKIVFENLLHDFPKRILYFVPDRDTLRVRIEGDKKQIKLSFVKEHHAG